MSIQIFIFILLIHFLADFGLQTHEQAIGKGEGHDIFNKQLFYHVAIYSLIWLIASSIFLSWSNVLIFTSITFVCHYTTDFITSRVGKPYWAKQDMHNGFVNVGFDQLLHYIQLILTFKYLFYE